MFGGLRLTDSNGSAFQTKGKRHKLFLALVAMQESGEITRHTLAANLFDEQEIPSSPNLSLLLNRVSSALRSHSPTPVFSAEHEVIKLNGERVWVDVQEFLHLLRQAECEFEPARHGFLLAQALGTWGGDLVPELEHPLITPIRERMRGIALKALLDLARSPVAQDYQVLMTKCWQELEPLARHDSQLIGNLLKTCAEIGFVDQLVPLFSNYEAWLNEEFGETPSRETVELLDRLLGDGAPMGRASNSFTPVRPEVTLGRAPLLREIGEFARDGAGGRILTLVGLSGIGKSHLLAEAFWQIDSALKAQFVDFELVPERALLDRLMDRRTDCLIIDHAEHVPPVLLHGLLRQFPGLRIILAAHDRTGLPGERVLQVPPLEVGSDTRPLAAVDLVKYHANQHLVASFIASSSEKQEFAEVAALCDGVPLALEIAGKLLATIGFRATIQALRTNVRGLELKQVAPERHQSVGHAIFASFARMSPGAKNLVRSLSFVHRPCHAALALAAFGCTPEELQEAFLCGLIRRISDSPAFLPLDSASYFLRAGQAQDEPWDSLSCAIRVAEWFHAEALRMPVELHYAVSLGVAIWAMGTLRSNQECELALRLLADLKPWMGSERIGDVDTEVAEALVRDEAGRECPSWPKAVLSLGALYFHANRYEEMDRLLGSDPVARRFMRVELPLQIHREMQVGLANRCLDRFEQACAHYRRASVNAAEAGIRPLVVGSNYNLATLLETMGRYDESLQAYYAASEAFGLDTDVRLENFVNSGVARLRHILGHDLDEIRAMYEVTLMHAMDRDDRRVSAEILQNLGLVYADQGQCSKASLFIVVGLALMLDFGYTVEFRQLAKSSLAVMGCCLNELGERQIADSSRLMIDRMGPSAIYCMAERYMVRLQHLTYVSPPNMQHGIATEADLSNLLRNCYECLTQKGAAADLPIFQQLGERFVQPRLLA